MRLADSSRALKVLTRMTRVVARYSATLSGPLVGLIWFTPWRVPLSDRARAKQARWLATTEPIRVRRRRGTIAGYTAGEGRTVILVHGWGETAGTLGGFIAPLVDRGFRVVGMDLPGHGGSSRGRTNVLDAGDAIADVARHFGGAHAVIAHSMGGNAALWAIKHSGLDVERVVLLAPNIDLNYTVDAFAFLFGIPPKAISGLRRHIERRFGRSVWDDIRGDLLARDLDIPGLVFHDRDDPQVPFEGSRTLAARWPAAELVEVPGAGHGAITRDAEVIERAADFIHDEVESQRLPRSVTAN
jgi:pimeloyl-ACP methyl ester carboxylesterase